MALGTEVLYALVGQEAAKISEVKFGGKKDANLALSDSDVPRPA